jgi:hypothetical protein
MRSFLSEPDEETAHPIRAIWRYFLHVVFGMGIFVALALVSLALHYVVVFLLYMGLPPELVIVFVWLEYGLLGFDCFLFAMYIIVMGAAAVRKLWRTEWTP